MRTAIRALSLLLAALACLACAAEPVAPAVDPPAAGGADAMPAEPQAEVGPNYVIGPGDSIQVFVWRNPELSVAVPVRPDGKVSTPLVEDMVAVGKTPTQLARDIEARLAEYIRSPQVNIIVTNPQSAFSKITVIGQVGQPGPVAYREGMKVLDVILAAGGLGQFAAGNRARLVRTDDNGKREEFRIRLEDLLKKGRLKENRDVRPGDLLIVPESVF